MAVNPPSKGFPLALPPSSSAAVFAPLVFVASSFGRTWAAMRLFGRLVYDIAVSGAVKGASIYDYRYFFQFCPPPCIAHI